jgi:hypothetical protein
VISTRKGEGGNVSATVSNRVPLMVLAATTLDQTISELKRVGARTCCSVPPSVAEPATTRLS